MKNNCFSSFKEKRLILISIYFYFFIYLFFYLFFFGGGSSHVENQPVPRGWQLISTVTDDAEVVFQQSLDTGFSATEHVWLGTDGSTSIDFTSVR